MGKASNNLKALINIEERNLNHDAATIVKEEPLPEHILRLAQTSFLYYHHVQLEGVIDYTAQLIGELCVLSHIAPHSVSGLLGFRSMHDFEGFDPEVTIHDLTVAEAVLGFSIGRDTLYFRAAALILGNRFDAASKVFDIISRFREGDDAVERARSQLAYLNSVERVPLTEKATLHAGVSDGTGPAVYRLRDVSLLGRFGFIQSRDGKIVTLSGVSGDPTDFGGFIIDGIPEIPENTFESAVALYGHGADNFWHWFTEQLPRLYWAERSGFSGSYLVPYAGSFIRESLELLGIDSQRIIEVRAPQRIAVRELFVPSQSLATTFHVFPDLLVWLRAKLSIPFNTEGAPRKLYLSRKTTRVVRNERNLLKMLDSYGFEEVCFDAMPLTEQLKLVAQAGSIIGPHGAAFTHALFIKSQSLVIELFSPNYVNPILTPINKVLQHRYYMVASPNRVRHYPLGDDIEAPIDVIEQILDRELSRHLL